MRSEGSKPFKSSHGHKPITAFKDGSIEAASCEPPPPIDQPETAKLLTSILSFNGESCLEFSSLTVTMASSRAVALAEGQSAQGSFVPKVMATIPCEA